MFFGFRSCPAFELANVFMQRQSTRHGHVRGLQFLFGTFHCSVMAVSCIFIKKEKLLESGGVTPNLRYGNFVDTGL